MATQELMFCLYKDGGGGGGKFGAFWCVLVRFGAF
jgi:hypothetical protein